MATNASIYKMRSPADQQIPFAQVIFVCRVLMISYHLFLIGGKADLSSAGDDMLESEFIRIAVHMYFLVTTSGAFTGWTSRQPGDSRRIPAQFRSPISQTLKMVVSRKNQRRVALGRRFFFIR